MEKLFSDHKPKTLFCRSIVRHHDLLTRQINTTAIGIAKKEHEPREGGIGFSFRDVTPPVQHIHGCPCRVRDPADSLFFARKLSVNVILRLKIWSPGVEKMHRVLTGL